MRNILTTTPTKTSKEILVARHSEAITFGLIVGTYFEKVDIEKVTVMNHANFIKVLENGNDRGI